MALKQFDTSIDLKKNQIVNGVIENRATDTASPITGQMWYRTDDITNGTTGRLLVYTTSGGRKIAFLEDITAQIGNYIPLSQKGIANGVATLDSNGVIPTSQLPSYVDDVLEFATRANFPANGETGKLYLDIAENKAYRWSGSAYVKMSDGIVLGTETPQDIGTTSAVGNASTASPINHVHKLGSGCVGNNNIQDFAVGNSKIADYAITTNKINDLAVSTGKLGISAVSNDKLAYMPGLTVKGNISSSSANASDVTLDTLATYMSANSTALGTVKSYSNPSLTPSGGQCTWTISGALNAAKKRLGYYVPIIQIWEVGTTNKPTEMDINIDNSTGNITIYFNSKTTIPANTYIARISE